MIVGCGVALLTTGLAGVAAVCNAAAPRPAALEPDGADEIREIGCLAGTEGARADFQLRLSASGKVREGTVARGEGDAEPTRLEIVSVRTDADRLHVEAKDGSRFVRFNVARAGFEARTKAPLDAQVEGTNDPAVAGGAGALSCLLGDARVGPALVGDDARLLFERLAVRPRTDLGESEKVIDVGDGFRLHCATTHQGADHVCTIRVPALVTSVARGSVTYGYALGAYESRELAAALAGLGGSFVGTTFVSPETSGALDGARVALRCVGTSCRVLYTVPDRFAVRPG